MEAEASVMLLWLPALRYALNIDEDWRLKHVFPAKKTQRRVKPAYLRAECLKTASAKACPSSRGPVWLSWLTRARCLLRWTRSWWLAWGMLGDSRILFSLSPHSSTLWLSARQRQQQSGMFRAGSPELHPCWPTSLKSEPCERSWEETTCASSQPTELTNGHLQVESHCGISQTFSRFCDFFSRPKRGFFQFKLERFIHLLCRLEKNKSTSCNPTQHFVSCEIKNLLWIIYSHKVYNQWLNWRTVCMWKK